MQTPPPAISPRIITQAHSIHMNNNIHTGVNRFYSNKNVFEMSVFHVD